jgi:hypothetical protein
LHPLYFVFVKTIIMSSIATMTMTLESEIPSFPQPPKKPKQHVSVREITPLVDLEMSPLPSGTRTPFSGDETISRRPSSEMINTDQGSTYDSSQIETVWQPFANRFRVLAACLTCFGNGMNDSAPGALIASIEK